MANYMDQVLTTLREQYGITNDDALAYIRAELLRSWKNGIERGRNPRPATDHTKRPQRSA